MLSFAVGTAGERADAVRCPLCSSLELVDEPRESTPDDWSVDDYVELTAGMGSIAEVLEHCVLPTDRRLLDVGCGYGLSLDYAAWRHRVAGVGIEPSWSASRGSTELGLDIRRELLTEHSDVGADYDVVFSSEVLEHVTDPVGFLVQLRRRLAPGGRVVLTTPNADIVGPSSPPADVDSALSAGYHVFLASAEGLALLLERAGFASWSIATHGISLRAVARADEGTVPTLTGTGPDTRILLRYYRSRIRRAPRGSSLACGMATRALRAAVALGDLPEARRARRKAIAAFRARYGIQVTRPDDVRRHLDEATRPPHGLGSMCFGAGMLDLLSGSPAEAVQWFDAAIEVVSRREAMLQLLDLESADVLVQSRYHRLLVLTGTDPEAAAAGVAAIRVEAAARAPSKPLLGARMGARIFTTLVSNGSLEAATVLVGPVRDDVAALLESRDREELVTGRDALFALGTLAAQRGQPALARDHLLACIAACDAIVDDTHASALLTACRAALETVGQAPAPVPTWMIDTYWCDANGTFVQGWVHVDGTPASELRVATTGQPVVAGIRVREDLREFWPDAERVHESGFRVYIPGPPGPALEFTLHLGADALTFRTEVPNGPLPRLESASTSARDLARQAIADAPAGPVLELGARTATPAPHPHVAELVGEREVVGVDIHAGHRVDIVGDIHTLSSLVTAGRFPVVISYAVLEHVTTPWIVAREIARVLPIGGVTVHVAPWVWPSHAQPNDFWRFSETGLARLFGPELGFEVLGSGSQGDAFVHAAPDWRSAALEMPTTASGSMAWVVAVKVDDRASHIAWPYDAAAGAAVAAAYPVEAIMGAE